MHYYASLLEGKYSSKYWGRYGFLHGTCSSCFYLNIGLSKRGVEICKKKNYANGQEVYKYDVNKPTYYYKSGKIKAEGPFENDQMEGEWRFYRESGQLWQIGNFRNSKKHGTWTRFDKNNQQEYHELFKLGKLTKTK